MTLKTLVLLASATLLSACVTATPYQPAQNEAARNGYSQTQIEDDRVRVSFDGNSQTKRETVETYLLYRAAELTTQKGYDYFILTDRSTDEKTRTRSSGPYSPYYGFFNYSYFSPYRGWSSPHYRPYAAFHGFGRGGFGHSRFGHSRFGRGFGHGRFGHGFGGSFGSYGGYQDITRYRASAEVKFGRGTKPADAANAFTASEVLNNLGEKIIYPEVKT